MKAIPSEGTSGVSLIDYHFQQYTGAMIAYKEHIDSGNIAPTGSANEKAKEAESILVRLENQWAKDLYELRKLIVAVRTTTATLPEEALADYEAAA